MIATLREEYVNTWLLAKDLDRIAEQSTEDEIRELCQRVREHYDYPVDSVLITPDLEVVGHLNVQDPDARDPHRYLAFLHRGMAAAGGVTIQEIPRERQENGAGGRGPAPRLTRALKLGPEQPNGILLDVIQQGALGQQSMTFFAIDLTAFAAGGTLEVSVRVGSATAPGKFELCAEVAGQPGLLAPVMTLPQVAPEETARMVYEFAAGAVFGLATMTGPGCAEGDTNAFLATVTVRTSDRQDEAEL